MPPGEFLKNFERPPPIQRAGGRGARVVFFWRGRSSTGFAGDLAAVQRSDLT